MNRMKLNYYIDLILIVLFLLVAVTGFVMYLVIPSGVPRGRYQEYLGITKATWTLVHNTSAFLMTLFTGIHFALHRRWMYCITRTILKKEEDDQCQIK